MTTKPKIAISVKDIHKEFILPQSKNSSFKQAAVNIVKQNNKVTQKVLDGVSFDIHKGDFFGVVGRNGSGKSTLLKMLAGVYTPTSGEIEVNGGITPFIELGVGFNMELSGRDNVYLNSALLGYTRKQTDTMYDEIVSFAELEPFMDQKLKNYSSGMQVRLAFSIAIMAKNDILIFDEVLAVGDEAFQAKCFDVFEKYKAAKQTVILVTHDMANVKKFCNRAVFIEEGKIIAIGDPRKVADEYSQSNKEVIEKNMQEENERENDIVREQRLKARLLGSKAKKNSYKFGEMMSVEVDLSGFSKDTIIESVGVSIFKQSGEHITGENSRFAIDAPIDLHKTNKLSLEYELTLQPGRYNLYIEAFDKPGSQLEALSDGLEFMVTSPENLRWSGLTSLNHSWNKSGKE
jgi:ABC-type polysaccharide/polyol phosphate transport system ATPase subunit